MADVNENPIPAKIITRCAFVVMGAILLFAVVFLSNPELDLVLSGIFADGAGDGAQRFSLRRHPIALFLNEVVDEGGYYGALFLIAILIYTSSTKKTFFKLGARKLSYIFFNFLIGPGLIANALFKENWGRARPRDNEFFGGSLEFSPPFVIANQCPTNCSFVSGDASFAFTTLCIALVIPKNRPQWIAGTLLFGVIIGMTRVVQGAHFPSDTVFAGLFMILTALVLHMIIIEDRGGISRKIERNSAKVWRPLKASLSLPKRISLFLTELGLINRPPACEAHVLYQGNSSSRDGLRYFFKSKRKEIIARKEAFSNSHANADKASQNKEQ